MFVKVKVKVKITGLGTLQRAPGPGALDTSAALHVSVSNTVIVTGGT